MKYTDIEYLNVEPNDIYSNLTEKVINKCFETENLTDKNITISIIFTTPIDIQAYNKEYRNIDRATDVLSFPMFEKDEVEKLQKENEGSIIIAKNGIFFVAIGKDAIILNEELGLKLTCMRKELCKVGFLVKNVEKYIEKLEKLGYSFILYVKNEKDELEEIYRYKGKNTEETRNCLKCVDCENKKEQEEDILERVKKLGKAK